MPDEVTDGLPLSNLIRDILLNEPQGKITNDKLTSILKRWKITTAEAKKTLNSLKRVGHIKRENDTWIWNYNPDTEEFRWGFLNKNPKEVKKMVEIYYPDGSMGMVSKDTLQNPPIYNPKGERASSKHTLISAIDGKPVKADVGFFKIEPVDVVADIERIQKDSKGKLVKEIEFVKTTGQLLPPGTRGRKLVNEDGEDVASGDIHYFQKTTTGEEEVRPFSKTQDIEIMFKPESAEDMFAYKDAYEVVPDDEASLIELWKLVKYLADTKQVGAGIVVMREGWTKLGVVFIPKIEAGKFTLIVKTTGKKLSFAHQLDIPTKTEVPKAKEIKTGVEELFK